MADAADLAGLNLMGLINAHTAAALQYGIERDFANRSQTILLYDMGSGTTEVALVKFSVYTVKEAGKPKVRVAGGWGGVRGGGVVRASPEK